jgi:hypothetical protein
MSLDATVDRSPASAGRAVALGRSALGRGFAKHPAMRAPLDLLQQDIHARLDICLVNVADRPRCGLHVVDDIGATR